MSGEPILLSIVEEGGYPDFADEYRAAGFRVVSERTMRKALSTLKKLSPAVVVAEFNFQSDFRDRTSSLESLLATLQSRHPESRVIILYDKENERPFEDRLRSRWAIEAALAFPVKPEDMRACLQGLHRDAAP